MLCHTSQFSRKPIPSKVIIWCPPTIYMYVYISGNQYTCRCTCKRWPRMGCDDGACLKFIPWLDPTKTLCPQVFLWILSLPDHSESRWRHYPTRIRLEITTRKPQEFQYSNITSCKQEIILVLRQTEPIAVPNICTKHIKEAMCSMTSSYLWHPAKLTSVCSIQ